MNGKTGAESPASKRYSIWDEVLAASSDGAHRRRTAYFYRKWAICFAQDARKGYLNGLFPDYTTTHASLAKDYLHSYRALVRVREMER